MSSKAKRSNSYSKRFDYDCEDSQTSSADMNVSSSEDESYVLPDNAKVRKRVSIRDLFKESENYEMSEDHIYTKVETPKRRVSDKSETKIVTRRSSKVENETSNVLTRNNNRKRKTETSDSYEGSEKKQKCFSKNAIMARLNRERKKKYISTLENDNTDLRDKNEQLNQKLESQEKLVTTLKRDVTYLKSLLANSKELTQILRNLNVSTGLPVSSSVNTYKNQKVSVSPEHGYVSDNGMTDTFQEVGKPPRTKCVTGGSNFPISARDINLGSLPVTADDNDFLTDADCNDDSDLLNSPLFPFEADHYLEDYSINNSLNDPFENDFDLKSPLYGIPAEAVCNFNKTEGSSDLDMNEMPTLPDIGVCLHVNQKRISLEFCSTCNSNAVKGFTGVSN